MKRHYRPLFILAVLLVSNAVHAATINFDDGAAGEVVGSFYASQGITFSNAAWIINNVGTIYVNGQATAPLSISSVSSGTLNSSDDPIVAIFDTPKESVSILAVNVGFAGARIDAYNAIMGGSLVDSAEAFGTTQKGEIPLGNGLFEHEEFLLAVSGPQIKRIELYRPNPSANDGINFDNLTVVPLPSSLLFMASGMVLGIFGYWRKDKSRFFKGNE